MTNDPRDKNFCPKAPTAAEYLLAYSQSVHEAVQKIPADLVNAVFYQLSKTVENGGRIYIAGNGGSAAIASHLCCDWMKGTRLDGHPNLKVHSLAENTALLTALANDVSYEDCFSEQIQMFGEEGDLVVLISSSGNSPNVVKAAKAAREKKMSVISFTGFAGGILKEVSDLTLHVPIANYGMVEDGHQMLMHVLAQFLYLTRSKQTGRPLPMPQPRHESEIPLSV